MIPAALLGKMYSYLSDEEAKELGTWAANNFGRDFVLFRFKKMDLDSVLESLTLLNSRYARIFHLEHNFEGRIHTIIVTHGYGKQGSIFNEEFLRVIFADILKLAPELVRTDNQVVARVRIAA
jgi:hypothetical protein